jgi:hypothetical protein
MFCFEDKDRIGIHFEISGWFSFSALLLTQKSNAGKLLKRH